MNGSQRDESESISGRDMGEPNREGKRSSPTSRRRLRRLAIPALLLLAIGGGGVLVWPVLTREIAAYQQRNKDFQRIVGEWREIDGTLTIEFYADGRVRDERMPTKEFGEFQIRPNHQIRMIFGGIDGQYTIGGHYPYQIDNDDNRLVITQQKNYTYKRLQNIAR